MGVMQQQAHGTGMSFTAAMDRHCMAMRGPAHMNDARRRLETMEATTRLQHLMESRTSGSRKAKESQKDHAWRQRIARRTHTQRVRDEEEAEMRRDPYWEPRHAMTMEQTAAEEAIASMSSAYMQTLESVRAKRAGRRIAAEAEANAKQEAAVARAASKAAAAQSVSMLMDLGFEDAAACEEALTLHDGDWKKAVKYLMMQDRVQQEGEASSSTNEEVYTVTAGNDYWCPVEVTLTDAPTTTITYEVMATSAESELIGAFSHNKKPWAGGDQGEDALTWYAAPHRADFSFRTKVFGGFPKVLVSKDMKKVSAHTWHQVEVKLGKKHAAYSVDGKHFAMAVLKGDDIARTGFVGMIRYASDYQFKNLKIVDSQGRILWPPRSTTEPSAAPCPPPRRVAAFERAVAASKAEEETRFGAGTTSSSPLTCAEPLQQPAAPLQCEEPMRACADPLQCDEPMPPCEEPLQCEAPLECAVPLQPVGVWAAPREKPVTMDSVMEEIDRISSEYVMATQADAQGEAMPDEESDEESDGWEM